MRQNGVSVIESEGLVAADEGLEALVVLAAGGGKPTS
jgi:hypothetical protein